VSRRLPLRKLTAHALAASVFAVGTLLLSVAPSGAQDAEVPLVGDQVQGKDPKPLESGDDRAIARPKNVTKCEDVRELKDDQDVTKDLEVTVTDNTYITIDEIPEGIELTGVVVKGSDGYNLYLPENLDENGWVRLHSPIAGGSDKPANISHWFACGKETDTEPTTSPSSSSSSSSTTTSSSAGGGGGGSDDDDLANTGTPAGQLLLTAGALLAIGAGLVMAARRRAFGRS